MNVLESADSPERKQYPPAVGTAMQNVRLIIILWLMVCKGTIALESEVYSE